jgi:hypothetical protein
MTTRLDLPVQIDMLSGAKMLDNPPAFMDSFWK